MSSNYKENKKHFCTADTPQEETHIKYLITHLKM